MSICQDVFASKSESVRPLVLSHCTYLTHNHYRVCTCARMFAVCSFTLRDEDGGVQLGHAGHLSLGVEGYFNRSRDRSVVLCLSILDAGACVRGCMCVYTHTLAHTAHRVLDVSPGVGTRHLKGPKNPDRLNLAKMYSYLCIIQSTHVYIYAARRD